MATPMTIGAYVVGFGAAAGSIAVGIINFAGHKPVHNSLPLIVFGAPLLVAMFLMLAWNKAGTVSAGAGTEDTGLSASFDLDTGQWVIIFGLVLIGAVAGVLTGTMIHG
jgi:hypothetical protein